MTETQEATAKADNQFGPYQLMPNPAAMVNLALGSACTIATLLSAPDAVALIPSSPDPITWLLRVAGMWLSAFILWSFSFLGLLHLVKVLGSGILLDSQGVRLWRFGKRICWSDIKAVAVERQPMFSRMFCLKPVASRLTIYEQKPAGRNPFGGKGKEAADTCRLAGHNIPSFQFLPDEFTCLLAHISQMSFRFLPDAQDVLIADESCRRALKTTFEKGRLQRLALSLLIAVSLISFLGRKAALNYTFNLANKDFRQQDYAAAANNYQIASAIDPFFAPAWDQLARSEFRQGKTEEAEAHWLKALSRKPDMVESKLGLSNIYMQRRQFDKARRLLEQSIRLAPRYTAAYLNLAELNLRLGRYPEAIKLSSMVLSQSEADPRAYGLLAQAILKLGDVNQAAMLLEEAREQDKKVSKFPFVRLVAGEILLAQGRISEAAGIFEELQKDTPLSGDLLLDLSRARMAQGRLSEAQELLAAASAGNRRDPVPVLLNCQLALMQNDQSRAKELLASAAALDLQDAPSLRSCARLFSRFKEDSRAKTFEAKAFEIEQAVEQNPGLQEP